MSTQGKRILLAIGGNSLVPDGDHRSVQDQYRACETTCSRIAGLIARGYQLVITHGNGPQVGFILRRSELARQELHEVPLDSCVADTQGAIGYQIQQALGNQTRSWPRIPVVATVVTRVLVDRKDPSFQEPTKPIGSFLSAGEAEIRRSRDGWNLVEDSGRGFRRVVPSPRPSEILELEAIRRLVDSGAVVIAAGGGGIPVARGPEGELTGVEAVVDKDLASSLLARELEADLLVISTSVERVWLRYRQPDQAPLDRVPAAEARRYLAAGEFPPGSMGPKVLAAVEFAERRGRPALITDPDHLLEALAGHGGTWILP